MSFDDFRKHFCEVSIVRAVDSFFFNNARLPAMTLGSLVGVEVVVPKRAEVTFEVRSCASSFLFSFSLRHFQCTHSSLSCDGVDGVLWRR
jgi:hypothetical protein